MTSKQVTDRDRSTTTAVSMLTSYSEPVQEGATAALAQYLEEGETMPQVGLLMLLLARSADASRTTLKAADEAHERELSDDAKPREDRDLREVRVIDLTVAARNTVSAIYGLTGLAALGIKEPMPSSTLGRARYARGFVNALRNPEVVLPEPRSKSMKLDRADLADELDVELVPLEAAMAAVTREESEAKGTQTAKITAMEANDQAFSIATGVGRQVFRLCGLTKLADGIRESPRRPGQLDVVVEGDETEDPGAGR